MKNIELKVGTKIELELIDSSEQKIGQTYISQVLDIDDDGLIMIAAPIHESRLTFILSGTNIRILFLHDTQGLLSLTGTIAKKDKSGNIAAFYIKSSYEFKKIQRRQYFRFDCNLPVNYRFYTEKDHQEDYYANLEIDSQKAVTKDVSGCGACIVTGEEIQKGSLIAVQISLPNSAKINALCKVIRSQQLATPKDKKHQIGLYFTQISHKDQDTLIKFIFDQERLLLKKTSWKKD